MHITLNQINHLNHNSNDDDFFRKANHTYYSMYIIHIIIIITFLYISLSNNSILYNSSLRILDDNSTEIFNQSTDPTLRSASKEERSQILSMLLYESYKGRWSSNVSLPNFQSLNGTVQLFLKINQNIKGARGLFYNYDFFIFDGDYNQHLIRLTNTYYFAIDDSLPLLFLNSDNNTIYLNNSHSNNINEIRYLTIIKSNSALAKIALINEKSLSYNKSMNGTIEYDNMLLEINMTKNNINFYYDILFLSISLINIGVFQLYAFKQLLKKLEENETESLKYSSISVMFNCIINNGIGLKCFLASLYDAKLFSYFILPTLLYIFNNLCVESIIYKQVIQVYIKHRYTDHNIRMIFFKKYIFRFAVCSFLYMLLLAYINDLFFWKPFNYLIIALTFISQILYNFKSYHLKIISKRYIVIIVGNRLIPILFFRLKSNFLCFKPDYIFSGIIIGIMGLEVLILGIQRYYRNDFLYRKIYRRNEHEYYKSLKEIQNKHKNISISTCPVCFRGFIRGKDGNTITSIILTQPPNNNSLKLNDDKKKIEMKDVIPIEIENDIGKVDKNKDRAKLSTHEEKANNNEQEQMIKKKKYCFNYLCSCCTKKEKDSMDEIVMITPCLHIFHIECLQDWIKIKANCPVCRNELPPII